MSAKRAARLSADMSPAEWRAWQGRGQPSIPIPIFQAALKAIASPCLCLPYYDYDSEDDIAPGEWRQKWTCTHERGVVADWIEENLSRVLAAKIQEDATNIADALLSIELPAGDEERALLRAEVERLRPDLVFEKMKRWKRPTVSEDPTVFYRGTDRICGNVIIDGQLALTHFSTRSFVRNVSLRESASVTIEGTGRLARGHSMARFNPYGASPTHLVVTIGDVLRLRRCMIEVHPANGDMGMEYAAFTRSRHEARAEYLLLKLTSSEVTDLSHTR